MARETVSDTPNLIENMVTDAMGAPEFAAKSECARKNRIINLANEDGKIDPRHHQGSKSTVRLAEEMTQKNENIPPATLDLWSEVHSVKDNDGNKQIVEKKAMEMKEKVDKLLEEDIEAGASRNPNEIFFDAVGGWKTGVVPGLGSGAGLFIKKLTSRCSQGVALYASSDVAALHERMNGYDALMQEQREFHQVQFVEQQARMKELRAQIKEQRAQLEEQRKQLEETRVQLEENRRLQSKQFELLSQAIRENCGSQLTLVQPDTYPVGGAAPTL